MTDLEYRPGKLMEVQPINMGLSEVAGTLRLNEPVLVLLEPGDATRYTILLVPIRPGDSVSPHLRGIGIQEAEADSFLFVSKISGADCPGAWVRYGPDQTVGTHDLTELASNEWSRVFLAWWLTELCEVSE